MKYDYQYFVLGRFFTMYCWSNIPHSERYILKIKSFSVTIIQKIIIGKLLIKMCILWSEVFNVLLHFFFLIYFLYINMNIISSGTGYVKAKSPSIQNIKSLQ